MLIAKAMQEERYEDAQRILDGIPDRTVDKEERQAILYAREGKDEDAARTWEARVIRIAADLMGAIVGLIEIALRDAAKMMRSSARTALSWHSRRLVSLHG